MKVDYKQWWNSLTEEHQIKLLTIHYPDRPIDVYCNVSEEMIKVMYHSESDAKLWWNKLPLFQKHTIIDKYYHVEWNGIYPSDGMLEMMYEAEHREVKSIQDLWWDALSLTEKKDLLRANGLNDDTDYVTIGIIKLLWNLVYAQNVSQVLITNNSDKIAFASQMKDIPLEDRFDYAATILLTCPISIDDLGEIFNLLSGSLRKYKERSKK